VVDLDRRSLMTGVGSLAAASLLPEVQARASAAIDVPVEEPLELRSMRN